MPYTSHVSPIDLEARVSGAVNDTPFGDGQIVFQAKILREVDLELQDLGGRAITAGVRPVPTAIETAPFRKSSPSRWLDMTERRFMRRTT